MRHVMVPYYVPFVALSWMLEKERIDICQFWGLPAWREPSIFDKWQSLRLYGADWNGYYMCTTEWKSGKRNLRYNSCSFTDNKTEKEHQNTLEKRRMQGHKKSYSEQDIDSQTHV
jgi:hypothetical protein